MIGAGHPDNERLRLQTLRSLRLLDTPAEPFFDSITRFATRLFNVPSALVTFVDDDRQWFKSRVAFGCEQTPRSVSFCAHAILDSRPTVVLDARADRRFGNNPLVTGAPAIRFYAGAPLVLGNDIVVGTLCLIDYEPRFSFSVDDEATLMALAELVTERLSMLGSMAYMDEITGLPNLARFNVDVPVFTEDSDALHERFSYAVMIDICPLEYVNRMVVALGVHSTQQAAIESVARLTSALPTNVTLYRVGYARYAFLFKGGLDDACILATRCVSTHSAPLTINGTVPVDVASSAGVVTLTNATDSAQLLGALITAADDAREANAAVMLYDFNMKQRRERTFTILNSFKAALADPKQFRLMYQPRERLTDQVCVGAEALLRWDHPDLGSISPAEFIPIAEQTSLISALTDWVLNAALSQLSRWQSEFPDLRLSVNIAASDLGRVDFVKRVVSTLETYGVASTRLELEITEGALVQNSEQAARTLTYLRMRGITIAIDDFGSGYSNLSQLHHLPADVLKIDQTLVKAMLTSAKDVVIVNSTVRLAHELGYKVVAEGVEDSAVYELVAQSLSDEAQGYHIARPLNPYDFERWAIARQHSSGGLPCPEDGLVTTPK